MIYPTAIIEIPRPDISPYRRGNTGVEYVTTFGANAPGPHVVINALMHGNEFSGAVAVDTLFRLGIQPTRGRLTLSLANVGAYRRFNPAQPFASRGVDEDMNRLWSPEVLDSGRVSADLARARILRPVFEQADVLLDLHSMAAPGEPAILCGRSKRGRDFAARLGYPSWIVADDGHAAGKRLIECPCFADPNGHRIALLVECGAHWQAATAAAAVEICLRLLKTLDMLSPSLSVPERIERPKLVDVTEAVVARSDQFNFVRPFHSIELVPKAGTKIAHDGNRAIVTPYDGCALILPSPRVGRGHLAVRLGRLVE